LRRQRYARKAGRIPSRSTSRRSGNSRRFRHRQPRACIALLWDRRRFVALEEAVAADLLHRLREMRAHLRKAQRQRLPSVPLVAVQRASSPATIRFASRWMGRSTPTCDDQAKSTRCACRSCKRERKQPILTERCVHIPDKEVGGDRPAVLHDSALRFVKLSPSIAVQRDDVSENSNRRDCK
jgi:hypothetical protein